MNAVYKKNLVEAVGECVEVLIERQGDTVVALLVTRAAGSVPRRGDLRVRVGISLKEEAIEDTEDDWAPLPDRCEHYASRCAVKDCFEDWLAEAWRQIEAQEAATCAS